MSQHLWVHLFLILFASYIFSDFLLQQYGSEKKENAFWHLLKHGFLHGIVAYLLVGDWMAIGIVPLMAAIHMCVDKATAHLEPGPASFLMIRVLHVILLAILAILFYSFHVECYWLSLFGAFFELTLVFLSGFMLSVFTTSTYLELRLQPYLSAMRSGDNNFEERGLKNGGRLIGRLERALIFLFTLSGHLMAVGFLVTAKSILRFGELKDGSNRKEAEYVIIGTLYSFFLALLVSMGTVWLIKALTL